ncbi:uncharacterized protein LOC128202914 [Mya arenaria]|uniref:uncharacterized protein LOC128202914 n=1 Tax=Mya arenaria TaxID=6604 RepID=UPI0022E068DB|nr:uncharacterized protein LOC128202914 [Mya arenaria]
MTVQKGLNITVLDSLNFLPMKLAALPKAFGLTELKKGWFPHFFNNRENQTYIGPYPQATSYGCEFMSSKEREELLTWFESKKDEDFSFRQEMLEYCRSDVDILRQACLKFRELLITATHTFALMDFKEKGKITRKMSAVFVDPFNFTTIASVCMGVYKTKYLKEDWEVKINDNNEWTPARYIDGNLEILKDNTWIKEGYLKEDKIKDKRFIKSLIAKVPATNRYQFSKSSIEWLEWMIKQERVHIQHALNGGEKKLQGTRYKLDGYCTETNTAYEYHDRLDPRESFFGGRTNASQLYYKTEDNENIKYIDFTSLYPWVNKYCHYPVGHPDIITSDFKNIDDYFGTAKVKILPPRGLYHPVLPYRSNGKLKFSLCRTCADNESQKDCECSEEDRALTGTWCTPEIKTAIRLGYRLLKVYEVYHWSDTTQYNLQTRKGGLFSKYINTFLKLKQEANGPPEWIKNEEDTNKYIKDYFEKEGVSLDHEAIVKNPGLRALAKLCLNSFWGKFGQCLNMRQTVFFHQSEVDKFFQIFTDPMKQPQNFHIVAEDTLQMEWTYKKDSLPEDNKTNIYLATFTTCWARLKLYSVLEDLDHRVIYFDTDSIVYVSRPGQYDPPLGDYPGELTDELSEGEHIVEFVSGGLKNYAYKTNTNKETCKVRGFTLNQSNDQF